jgi:predicted Zn finger-like uncharacterized protein
MILTCPECATRYQTDAAAFAPPGRKVRCAKCGHVWHQVAPPSEPEASIDAPPPREEVPRSESRPDLPISSGRSSYVPPQAAEHDVEEDAPAHRRTGSRIALAFGWLSLIAIVLAIGWSAVVFRQQIATLWPQSATLYARLGMDVNARGLDFLDQTTKREMQDGQFVLAVTGRVVNVSQREVPVPKIVAALLSNDKRRLYSWSFSVNTAILQPGESVAFVSRVPNPPQGARTVVLRFAEAGG